MENFSPATRAILEASRSTHLSIDNLAATLRAVADQILPIRLIDESDFSPGSCCERVLREERAEIRADLLAIAAELDGTNRSESDY